MEPTHTDRYQEFKSHHPLSHKVSVIKTLYSRARCLSSTSILRIEEEAHILQALLMNCYPQHLVQMVRDVVSTTAVPPPDPKDQEPIAKVSLPYIRPVSDCIARILRRLNIKVSFHPLRTLRHSLVRVKDEIPALVKNGVVYQVPCKDCQSSYVGQTKRSLAVRLKEHKRAVFNGDKETSALAEHVLSTGHNIDWANVSIVASCDHLSQRLYLESWYIQKQRGGATTIYIWTSHQTIM